MNPPRRTQIIAGSLLLAGLTACVALVQRVDAARPQATLQDTLYITSPSMVRRLSLGYTGLAASLYWTRAVQYFGSRHHRYAQSYELLAPLLRLTTALDPKLLVAYEFGGTFLAPPPPHGAGMPDAAVELIESGIRANPDKWRLYYALGFVHYMERKDYAAAARAFQRGSEVPNAHPFLKLLAARMATQADDPATARMMWTATYDTTQDNMIRDNAEKHLRALQVEDDVTDLEKIVDIFAQRFGHKPVSFREMAQRELLPGIPLDPFGQPYQLTPEGKVLVRQPEKFPFLHKGLPPGFVQPFGSR
jgi:tetratricopeptide (TPR) repeat protein